MTATFPEPVELEVPFTLEACASAYRMHLRHAWRGWMYFAMACIFIVLTFALLFGARGCESPNDIIVNAAISVVVGIALIAIMAFQHRRVSPDSVRKMAEEYGLIGSITRYSFDHEKLSIDDKLFGGELQWKEAFGWDEGEELILIYRFKTTYYVIPKSGLDPETVEKLTTVMQAAGVPRM